MGHRGTCQWSLSTPSSREASCEHSMLTLATLTPPPPPALGVYTLNVVSRERAMSHPDDWVSGVGGGTPGQEHTDGGVPQRGQSSPHPLQHPRSACCVCTDSFPGPWAGATISDAGCVVAWLILITGCGTGVGGP